MQDLLLCATDLGFRAKNTGSRTNRLCNCPSVGLIALVDLVPTSAYLWMAALISTVGHGSSIRIKRTNQRTRIDNGTPCRRSVSGLASNLPQIGYSHLPQIGDTCSDDYSRGATLAPFQPDKSEPF